jgi:hypothetical protein
VVITEGSSLTVLRRTVRTPPGSEVRACSHRGGLGTWESQLFPCGERKVLGNPALCEIPALRWKPRPLASPFSRRHKRIEKGKTRYWGTIAKSEVTQDGQLAVLVDHSTAGQIERPDREGGEVRPKRPTAGKVTPGITSF